MGENKIDKILLELYGIYVKAALANTNWRLRMNLAGVIINGAFFLTHTRTSWAVCAVMIANNFFWYLNIISAKKLSSAKFKVIFELEEKLGTEVKPFTDELVELKKLKRIRFTKIEQYMPLFFILVPAYDLFVKLGFNV